ncbi:phage tail assembly chaperone [Martelella alba]|uniref:Phage tail protein n=1 Tax=Martelella alba TaxID=2590451 RepID=A0ABY2SDS8_9HYPH|nr:phage tail assembly chaperone [Martelella alba]TKI02763.1 phage tail protein [Martelella alba]
MAKKILSLRDQVLAPLAGFRTKTVQVPEWNGVYVKIREPSGHAWAQWRSILTPEAAEGEESPKLTESQQAHRNISADVVLFIDVLLDENDEPVFSHDDVDLVQSVYGPVHARLLKQALDLTLAQDDAGKKSVTP